MANIQVVKGKRAKRFKASIRREGCRSIYKTFGTEKDAQRFAIQIEDAMDAGKFEARDQASQRTLDEALDRYIEVELPRRKRQDADHVRHLAWWRKKLGKRKLSQITPAAIVECRDELLGGMTTQGKPRQPATVNRILATLSNVFTVIVKDFGWMDDSPASRVRKLREPRGRVRFLSDDERTRLLAVCQKLKEECNRRQAEEGTARPLYLPAIIMLALTTGMRRGEIQMLRWHDIDWRRGMIVLEHTKNDERRSVPLVGAARIELEELAKQSREGDVYIFASEKRGFEGQPKSFEREWQAALIEACITNFRFHDLRHSCASYLAMNGATLTDIAAVLGHKTLTMVRRYAHLTESHVTSVVASMSARFIDAPSSVKGLK